MLVFELNNYRLPTGILFINTQVSRMVKEITSGAMNGREQATIENAYGCSSRSIE